MNHRKKISILVVLVVSMMLILPIRPAKAQFIIASWNYPDEYGQGIEALRAYQNISGSWVSLTGGFDLTSGDSTALEINGTATGVKILVKCWLNNTVVGAVDFEDGKNYLRHNGTLTLIGENIFSLQNFTYTTGTDTLDPMFYYQYEGIFPFTPIAGQTYTMVVTYEIFWGGYK